jgi:pyroglutamyl-peptidase
VTRVLLTAFEPFGGEAVNPSQEAARRLAAGPALPDVELSTAFLPVVYGEAVRALRAAVQEHDPEVVVCTGLAGGRYAVTPERVAINLDDAPMADNSGQSPVDTPIVPDGPVGYLSTLPVAEIVQALKAAGIPAAKSSTAGHYVCNHVFYGLMHLIATERPGTAGGFLHIPFAHEQVLDRLDDVPSLAQDTLTEAVRITVLTTVRALAPAR